ncbi:hypothetical protein BP5796_04196 [Coleophoma crateriformis]|uniref:Peptidase A1 domain-containing protein n=1 Tax=Coleophoma crateriformis TaxID=565419 RepID=A0A3D8SI69_9HELO|nr:hypothetical protein BP5796_04196 [Coleophoma crateriformis]
MRSLLKFGFFLCIEFGLSAGLEAADNITLAAPIIAVPSQHWEGNDGTWSTFEIRVGTPATTVRVLPATSWQEVWVIWGGVPGVCNTTEGVSTDCGDERGGLWEATSSSTWQQGDQLFLGLNQDLGYSGQGQYGFDTVGLGYSSDEGPTLTHQIVAEISSNSYFFGQLGIGFQPTNFSGYDDPQASFSDTLYSNGTISSMSWSYTAGAYYRLKGVFGQLIFGGYDASRFTPNDVVFTMTGDNLRDVVVTVRSIISTAQSGNVTLMSTPEFAFIDSTVPEMWLPADVCDAFESAFGLEYDTTWGLYLLDASTHENLLSLNPTITITLANQKSGGSTTDIVFPYTSFDLNVSAPIYNGTSKYFPLKRATDENQYTLGRVFLQEAYVTTHYNSRTFNVSQCIFSDSASERIVALPATLPTAASTATSSSSSNPRPAGTSNHKLSAGAMAGIVIGAVLGVLAIIGVIALFCLRRRRRSSQAAKENSRPRTPVAEIDAGKRVEPYGSSAYTAQASAFTHEAGGRAVAPRVEIGGYPIMHPQELEANVPIQWTRPTSAPHRSTDRGDMGGSTPASVSPTAGPGSQAHELSGGGIKNLERGNDFDDMVSPASPTMPGIMQRRRGDLDTGQDSSVVGDSPTISSEGHASPQTPSRSRRESRFEEHWGE